MLLYHGVSFFLARSKANKTPVPAFKIQQKGKKISRKVTNNFLLDLFQEHGLTLKCGYESNSKFLFQKSNIPTFEKLNAVMESTKPSVYTGGNREGIERVLKEDGMYAFFMEAAAIEYHTERNCQLTQIGGLLDRKGYGVALPPGKLIMGWKSSWFCSPRKLFFSQGLLTPSKYLQEFWVFKKKGFCKSWRRSGGRRCMELESASWVSPWILTEFWNNFWKRWLNTTELSFHFKEGEDANSGQLGLPNLGGVFIVLFGGMVMSCIIAVAEFMWHARQIINDPEVSIIRGSSLQCELSNRRGWVRISLVLSIGVYSNSTTPFYSVPE